MPDTSLAGKLQIKPGRTILLVDAPQGFESLLGNLPDELTFLKVATQPVDIILAFFENRKEMEAQLGQLKSWLKPNGILWVAYHKGTSKVKTDINRDTINAYAQTLGMQGVAMVSIDDDWSGLRLKVVG